MEWEKYYKLPLKMDEYSPRYAWTRNDGMALTFDRKLSRDNAQNIVNIINGTSDVKIPEINFDGVDFFVDDEYVFCVRGWGNLIGIGGGHLSSEKAEEIQDAFINFIYNKLK